MESILAETIGGQFSNPDCRWGTPNAIWLTTDNLDKYNNVMTQWAKLPTRNKPVTTEEANKIASALYGANITVHLAHKTEDSTESKVRTVNVNYINKSTNQSMGTVVPNAQIQIHYKRTTSKDLVTNQISTSDWEIDTSQGKKGYSINSGNWNISDDKVVSIDVPTVTGYSASPSGTLEFNKVGEGNNWETTTTVDYTPKSESVAIKFINGETGEQIGSDVTQTGTFDQTVDIQTPANYQLLDSEPKSYKFTDDSNQSLTLYVVAKKNVTAKGTTVFQGNTLTATDLVTNSADFPKNTKFQFVTGTVPNWNQAKNYNAQITATYYVTVNGKSESVTTDPVTVAINVTDQMKFRITYVDDSDDGKELVHFDLENPVNGGYSGDLKFPDGVNTNNYQSKSVSGIPSDGVYISGDRWTPFSNASCDWHIPNYVWLTKDNVNDYNKNVIMGDSHNPTHKAVTAEQASKIAQSLYGANIVVHLVHKTQETTEYKTRTATVKYINAKTGESMGNAQVNVFYKRTTTTDLATNTTTSTGWQLDTSQGTNGYTVTSGKWTLANGNISVAVPTIANYKAFTSGDWSNNVPANVFSISGFINNTNDNVEQTVYYAPETEARTITAYFKIFDGNKNDQDFRPAAQAQVIFNKDATAFSTNGSSDPSQWTITYNKATWDTNAGSSNYHVISGSWNFGGSISVSTPDAGNEYVKLDSGVNVNGEKNYTYIFSSPAAILYNQDLFSNNTDPTWYNRNELTTYYVPKSELNKNITRTINIIPPTGPQTSVPQNAVFSRKATLNSNDSGVDFGDWGSDKANWDAYTPTNYEGYTPVITQVNLDGSTTQLSSISQQTVNLNTTPVTINVTYTANQQTVTVKFVDDDNHGSQVGNSITKEDLPGVTIDLSDKIPNNYELAKGQSPTYKITTAKDQIFEIHLVHKTKDVSDTDPKAQETRTITVHYINAATGKPMGDLAPDAVLDVYYNRTAIEDLVTGNITYGNWSWDTSRGDKNPGFNVVSGIWNSLSSIEHPDRSIGTTPPEVNGYTSVSYNKNSDKNTIWISTPIRDPETIFTNNTDQTWSRRKDLYTYYVPDSLLNNKVTRTINIADPVTGKVTTHTQDANFARTATLNDNDDGVVYTAWNPDSASWPAEDVAVTGYTSIIKQTTHNPDGTTTTTTLSSIPTQTITGDTLPVTIYVSYTATATATLSGHGETTYDGKPITGTDLHSGTIEVVVTGPTAGKYALRTGDVEFSSDGGQTWLTMPTDAGYYQLRLTEQGKQNIINKFGNHSIKWVDANGNSTITGTATFTINKELAQNLHLHGDLPHATYNGQPAVFDPQDSETQKNIVFDNAQGLNIPINKFSASDFTWYNTQNEELHTVPKDKGTYYLRLNADGLQKIADANHNYSFVDDNGKSTITGQLTYTIDPKTLKITVSGQASKVFDRDVAKLTQEQINSGKIKLIWNNASTKPADLGQLNLTPGDFEVVDANGKSAIDANAEGNVKIGNPEYIVRLSAAGKQKLQSLTGISNYDISFDSNATYLIYARKAQITLTGTQTTIYGVKAALDPNNYHVELSNWPTDDTTLKPTLPPKLNPGDVQFVNSDFNNDNLPTEVGSYQVKISDTLRQWLKDHNKNYDIIVDAQTGAKAGTGENPVDAEHDPATYIIEKAATTVTINGPQQIYYGQDPTIKYGQGGYTLSITRDKIDDQHPEKTITDEINLPSKYLMIVQQPNADGKYDAGINYEVKLTEDAIKYLAQNNPNYSWNQASKARASFIVKQMPLIISINNTQTVVYGSQDWLNAIKAKDALTGFTLQIEKKYDDGHGKVINYTPQAGDLAYQEKPGNAGTYQVVLTAQGLQNIEGKLGSNYSYPQTAADATSSAQLVIAQAPITVTMNGNWTKQFGEDIMPSSEQLATLSYNNGQLVIYTADGTAHTAKVQTDDISFNGSQVPTNVGHYPVVISSEGQRRLEQLDGNNGQNYVWTFATNTDSKSGLTITPATGQATLSGKSSMYFNGHPVTAAEVTNDGKITVNLTYQLNGQDKTAGIYTLQDGDYTWLDEGKEIAAPTKVGKYQIKLNPTSILAHLQARLNYLAGTGQNGQSNVKIAADGLSGTAEFDIKPATQELAPETKEITRTIVITKPGHKQQTIVQKATISRKVIKNLVTGQISYGSWSTASWPGYTVAKLPHYQVKIEQTVNGQTTKLEAIDPVTVTVDTPSAVVNVTYVKQGKPKPDKPHKPHKPAKPNKPNRPSKPTVPNIPGSQRLPDGTIVGPHGEVYYKNGRWTRVGLYDLPQTSSKDQSLAAVTGGLLSSLGFLSLL